jgi:predicted Ser/Thr protein kinase
MIYFFKGEDIPTKNSANDAVEDIFVRNPYSVLYISREEGVLGKGSEGKVYKGLYKGENVAVKVVSCNNGGESFLRFFFAR